MGTFRNTFAQGMDQDSSKTKYDDSHYFDAQNIRIITQDGLSSGAIENILGNYRRVYTVSSGNNYIVGHVILRDYLILWTTNNMGTDRIWRIPISTLEAQTGTDLLTLDITRVHNGGNLLYEADLDLSTTRKIRAVGRYESDKVQKIYWVDGYNNFRHLNTIYDANTNDLDNLSVDKLEVISNFSVTRPEITSFGSGNLRSGKVQYTYQLYALNGNETAFSPMSHLINLTGSSEFNTSSDGYKGSELDVNTGKAVIGSIDITATGYNRIRILAVHYTTLYGDPQIRLIDEQSISSDGDTVTFVDSGQNLGSYTLEQIRLFGTYLFSAEDLTVKDNILFPSNITEKSFDINFDARAYRFAGASDTPTDPNYQATASLRRICKIFDINGNWYQGDGSNPAGTWEYYEPGSPPVHVTANDVIGWENIPETFDAINRFNDIDNDGDHNYRFMYQSDGATLGGEGPNIKYTFKLKTVELDDNSGVSYIKTGTESIPENLSYYNYASPYQCARYLGYARDEVYRYGIVFFDEKGRSSFVKWIGDIRMPSISTVASTEMYDPSGGGLATLQQTLITMFDYVPGSSLTYRVYIDGNVSSSGYGYTTNESSIDDVLSAVSTALGSIYVSIVGLIDYANNQVTIQFNDIGVHTITVERWDGYIQLDLNYTDSVTVAYVAAGTEKNDFSPVYYNTGSAKIMMNILYPEFDIDLTGTEAEDFTYQIVRVRRESGDRSILAQGLITGMYENGANRYPYSWLEGGASTWSDDLVSLNSPEIAFNRNLSYQFGDKLQVVGICDTSQNDYVNSVERRKYRNITALTNPQTPKSSAVAGNEFYSNNGKDLNAGTLVTMDTSEAVINGLTYRSGLRTNAGVEQYGDKGISFLCNGIFTSFTALNDAPANKKVVNYKRNVFLSQYGGNTYESRSRNTYMATGLVQKHNHAVIPVFDGDTYISMFDYLHSGWQLNVATGKSEVAIFPVETSINLDLRMDACYHAKVQDSSLDIFLMRERKGIYVDDDGSKQYTQETNLYDYNTVYSKENTTKIYISRPFDWTAQTVFDTRIIASGIKTNNELSDSWLNFGANSYIDVDPQYGELIALMVLNNQMLFFQPKAFGTISINERALVQTQSAAQLSLGTSGVLTRFDYAKFDVGVSHRDHILLTQNGLYWVDVLNKAMFRYSNGIEELSLMKGMQSWFRDLFTGTLILSNILLFHDPYYKEVNIVDNGKNINLVYNEITDSFISRYTYYPIYVINYNDKVISTSDGLSLYRHNDTQASRCSFYGNNPAASNITLIVNPGSGEMCVFNNLEWLTEVYNSTDNITNETFTSVRISNDYQDTGTIALVSGVNIRRRIRTWRHVIERALYDETGTTADRRDARIRDSYMKLKLKFNNSNPRRFIAHDIITSYMLSNK